MTTNKPEVFEVYRTRQGTLENVVLLADYIALQAECDALVEALSALRGCIMDTRGPDAHSALVLADAALAAHRKGGDV